MQVAWLSLHHQDRAEHRYHRMMAIENQIHWLGYDVVLVWECSHPELSTKELGGEFIPYPHYTIYDFEVVLAKKDLSVISDLMINSSHIPISVVINDSLTQVLVFFHNQDQEWLKEFIAELVRWEKIIFNEVTRMYPMIDEGSLPLRVRSTWSIRSAKFPYSDSTAESTI